MLIRNKAGSALRVASAWKFCRPEIWPLFDSGSDTRADEEGSKGLLLLCLAIRTLPPANKIFYLAATNGSKFLWDSKVLPFDGNAKQKFAVHSHFSSPRRAQWRFVPVVAPLLILQVPLPHPGHLQHRSAREPEMRRTSPAKAERLTDDRCLHRPVYRGRQLCRGF